MTPASPRRALAEVLRSASEHSEFGALADDLISDPRARMLVLRARRWGIVNTLLSRTAHAAATAAVVREVGRKFAGGTWTCEPEAIWTAGAWALALGVAAEDAAGGWDVPPPVSGPNDAGAAAPLPGQDVLDGLAAAFREACGRLDRVDETLDDLVADMHACDLLRRTRGVRACAGILTAAGSARAPGEASVLAAAAAAAAETATCSDAARWALGAWMAALHGTHPAGAPVAAAPAVSPPRSHAPLATSPLPDPPITVELGPADAGPEPPSVPGARGPAPDDPAFRGGGVRRVPDARSQPSRGPIAQPATARRRVALPAAIGLAVLLAGATLGARMLAVRTVAETLEFASTVGPDDDPARMREIADRREALTAVHVRHLAPAGDLSAAFRALSVAEGALATGFLSRFPDPVPVPSIGAFLEAVSEALSRPDLSAWTAEIGSRASQRIPRAAETIGAAERRTLAAFPADANGRPIDVPPLDGEASRGETATVQKWLATLSSMSAESAREALVSELVALGRQARDARVRDFLASRPDADRIADWLSQVGAHVDPGLRDELRRAESERRATTRRIRGAADRAKRGDTEGAAKDLEATRPAADDDPDAGVWNDASSAVQDAARTRVAQLLDALDFDAASRAAAAVRTVVPDTDRTRWDDVRDAAGALGDDPFMRGAIAETASKRLAASGERWRGVASAVNVASVRAVLARWKAGTDGGTQAEADAVVSASRRVQASAAAIRLPGREAAELAFAGASAELDLAVLLRRDAERVPVASPQIPAQWQRILEAKRERLALAIGSPSSWTRALLVLGLDRNDAELARWLSVLHVRCLGLVDRWAWPVIRNDRRRRGAGAAAPPAGDIRGSFVGPPEVWRIVHADADTFHRAVDPGKSGPPSGVIAISSAQSRYVRGVVVAAMLRCAKIPGGDAAVRSRCIDDLNSAKGAVTDDAVRADIAEEEKLLESR